MKQLKFLGLTSDEDWNIKGDTRKGANISIRIPKLAEAARNSSEKQGMSRKELKLPLDGTQISYMYRNGVTFDENGLAVNIPIEDM